MATDADAQPRDGTLAVSAPLEVDAVDGGWDEECDVLVTGFGAAGAASAISAHDAGARVLICERFEGGGATTISGGVVYLGGGTRHQRDSGFDDTPEAMRAYLATEVGDAVSPATLQRFCDDSRGMLDWLESLGVPFAGESDPPKTSYPRDGVYLYYSGNEKVPEVAAIAPPAPRGHRTAVPGMSGYGLFAALREAVAARGIAVSAQTAVRRLVRERATGAILGAEVARLPPGSRAARRHARLARWAGRLHNVAGGLADRLRARACAIEREHARTVRVRARNGVVLTTGGFVFNRAMVAEHAPAYGANLRLGATGCDGSGIRLGMSAGGDTARLHKASAWRFINPPSPWPKGLIVDTQGRRFCNEEVYGARLGVIMCEQHDGRAWLILDRELRRQATREALFGKLRAFQSVPSLIMMLFAPRARSITALARKLRLPAANVEGAVAAMNDAIAQQRPDPLGKSESTRHALTEGPFYAIDISATSPVFPLPTITLGGLRVDEQTGAVLDADDAPIPGLYAAGRAAVGLASNGYVSGLSLADCLWSGRRAGAAMAGGVQAAPRDAVPAPGGHADDVATA
ncbi:FAD-binding protein [Algiphilus sp.]|uniref:FAD-binding protein n=1 Tax=Algiphilus sp. TaxID=1872431 RepID=UPI0025BDC518|nr:FAD-binding protein [Algiphilus sp.]MCK5769677.1 FAD-binding protein [Algiphilus sp.]